MGKRKVAALEKIDADFASLQYKARRDPRSYQDEIARQYEQYVSQREIFLAAPTTASADQCESFHDLIDLLAHVCDLYPDFLGEFPGEVRDILLQHHASLQTDLRDKMVGSLCMLRRKEVISSEALLTTLFPVLVSTPSKSLRALIFNKIVGDLRNANSKSTNHPLNRTIQDVLYNLVTSDRTSPKAVWAVKVVRELWKRRVWTDAKPVHVIKEACLADVEKVVVGGVRFFLGGDQEREEADDDSSDDDAVDLKKIQHQQGINKKTRKSKKAYDRAVDKVKRSEKKKHQVHPLNFSALHLLHDPQGFAEQLFAKHLQPSKSKLRLESKLLVLQLVSRLHGLHKLTIMPLFSWFTKHLMPRQESVSTFLACLAQSTHSLVPPDALEPLMLKIANEFVSEAAASEVAAAGLNAIREVCMRNSLAMNETLLQDLVQYRRSKDKGVMMAARGLLSLYRDVAPELLRTRDRGKDATINLRAGEFKKRQFGEEEAGTIEGLELLEKWKEEQRERKLADGADKADEDDDGFHSSEWEVDSDDSSESGDWINVSDDEDEAPASKRQRKEGEAEADDDKENAEAEAPRLSKLATTTILTPADLAKLQELRMAADVDKAMGGSRARRQKEMVERHVEDPVTAEQIELPAKLRRSTKEERIALAREGKPDREEHKSTQAIRKSKMAAEGKSTTNREKARRKNMLMTMGKAKAKQKRSLVETRKVLRGHVERSKRGGRRGNGT